VLKAFSKLLKREYHEPLSHFAFNFNLRQYTTESVWAFNIGTKTWRFIGSGPGETWVQAGAYTRPLFSST
jgi:hypothetical protein